MILFAAPAPVAAPLPPLPEASFNALTRLTLSLLLNSAGLELGLREVGGPGAGPAQPSPLSSWPGL